VDKTELQSGKRNVSINRFIYYIRVVIT